MIQSESLRLACVCPACLYRCSACMGTNTVIPREALKELAFRPTEAEEPAEAEEARKAIAKRKAAKKEGTTR